MLALSLGVVLHAAPVMAQQAPVVGTTAVVSKDIAESAEFTGRVEAVDRVDILARVSGFLLSVGFQEGQRVAKGQTLFEIEPDSYKADIAQIEGQIGSAQAEKTLADLEVARQQELYDRKVSALNILQQAQAQQGKIAGQLQQLQGALQNAELNLSYATIAAPFDGRVGLTDMSIGAFVSPQSGALVTITSVDPIHVTFPVPEAELLNYIARGTGGPGGPPLGVHITLSNGQVYPQAGAIEVVDPQVQEGTDTVRVRATFPNPDGLLRDGQLVRVTLTQDAGTQSLTVPAQALQRDQGGYFVLVVGPENKVEKRVVTFGRLAGAEVVISGGVRAGEQVITEGAQRARPGATVTPQPASAAPVTGSPSAPTKTAE
ncbi:efflux RND transporter periplasmic adaptor subunit [Paracoccus aestuariivivens]|nr:efflux RND transporter periplasmic adaptor subunit [Paracoccus aestuariivivens]